jgi:ELWxxDGT repeat protein
VGNLTELDGLLYFTMTRDGKGNELWRTDGTAPGTVRLSDINPGGSDGSPAELTNINGRLFFTATESTHGRELWVYDPASPPGDFDGNRAVDGADFLLWQRQLGAIGPGLAADNDGNAAVDGHDLTAWLNHFGAPPAVAAMVSAAEIDFSASLVDGDNAADVLTPNLRDLAFAADQHQSASFEARTPSRNARAAKALVGKGDTIQDVIEARVFASSPPSRHTGKLLVERGARSERLALALVLGLEQDAETRLG